MTSATSTASAGMTMGAIEIEMDRTDLHAISEGERYQQDVRTPRDT